MADKLRIRITMMEDGKTPKRELMCDGYKVADLTFFDTLDLALSAASSLRWEKEAQDQIPAILSERARQKDALARQERE